MSIFSNTVYMNFHKNLIHGARAPFQGEPDAEKIRKIGPKMAKRCYYKGFFTIATLLYVIDVCNVSLSVLSRNKALF